MFKDINIFFKSQRCDSGDADFYLSVSTRIFDALMSVLIPMAKWEIESYMKN